jgi:hypothetical protein
MGDAHEEHFTDVLGQRKTRGSGNQWRDQLDGKHNRLDTEWAFASDGKSTLKKSISVSLEMWKKIVEQAGGDRPTMPVRFYGNESLKVEADLILSDLYDFAEMRQAALNWEQARPLLEKIVEAKPRCIPVLVELARRILEEADAQ